MKKKKYNGSSFHQLRILEFNFFFFFQKMLKSQQVSQNVQFSKKKKKG